MNTNLLRMLALAALCGAAVAAPTFGQTDTGLLPAKKAEGPNELSLDETAIQSRIALYSDTTKGQLHAEDAQQCHTVADRFISVLSARDAKDDAAPTTSRDPSTQILTHDSGGCGVPRSALHSRLDFLDTAFCTSLFKREETMGQGGQFQFVNSTANDWVKTAEHSYQMNNWTLPDRIPAWSRQQVYVEWSQGIFENSGDDGADTTYSIDGAGGTFTLGARGRPGFH